MEDQQYYGKQVREAGQIFSPQVHIFLEQKIQGQQLTA